MKKKFLTVEEKISKQAQECALTDREKEVLRYLLEGKKRSEIACALCVSEETIKKQITSIYRKMGVATRSELFVKFM